MPVLSSEAGGQNSIDNRFTSSVSSADERRQSRVQNNLVQQQTNHRRPSPQQPDSTKHSSTSRNSLVRNRPQEPVSSSNCTLDVREDETFLWRIDTQPPSYFFGTIHVPYTRVWDAVSDNAKKAFKVRFPLRQHKHNKIFVLFQNSDQVYFELDLTNPYTIASLTSCQLLPRSLNLSQVLPPGIYSRLRDHLAWVRQEMQEWITDDQVTNNNRSWTHDCSLRDSRRLAKWQIDFRCILKVLF